MVDDTMILSACGRMVSPEDVEHVREVARMCAGLSRRELALTLCEHWGWIAATGGPQLRACEKLLDKLEREEMVVLPAKRSQPQRKPRSTTLDVATSETAPGPPLELSLRALGRVWLERVADGEKAAQWKGLVQQYHPLGFKRSFGCSLRYFVASERGHLGCVLLASGARALRCRDDWIGWSAQQRLSNLPYVINNSRFLLFPWVRVPHLASHVLGRLARQIQDDWHSRWNYRPVLMETFVDPEHYDGTCYRAAGWQLLGKSSGAGLKLRGHRYRTTQKLVFVRPLARDFRSQLLSIPPGPSE
jgi:hypothetical protein